MTAIPWIQAGEKVVGAGHASLADVANRPLQTFVSSFGYDIDIIAAASMAGTTWSEKIQAAHDLLPASGGIIDARSLRGTQVQNTVITISKPSVTLLVGCTTLTASADIVITVTAHGFDLEGPASWSAQGLPTGAFGFSVNYTGSGKWIEAGDNTTDLRHIRIANIAGQVGGGGASARLIQLNRVIYWDLTRLNLGAGSSGGTSRYLLAINGTSNFTGYGVIDNCAFSGNSLRLIYVTGTGNQGGNAIQMIGGSVVGSVSDSTVGIYLDSGSNWTFEGTDFESCLMGIDFAGGAGYHTGTVRFEGCTTDIHFASTVTRSRLIVNSSNSPAAVTDDSTQNTILDPFYSVFKRNLWWARNSVDDPFDLVLGAGLTTDQAALIRWHDKSDAEHWTAGKDSSNTWGLYDWIRGLLRLFFGTANTNVNAAGGGTVLVNASAGSGTGGMQVWSGSGSPARKITIGGDGVITLPTTTHREGSGSPEGVITAVVGSTYSRTDGGAGTSFYVKETGSGNTGWVAK